jgi:hypothetical protein
LARLGGIIRDRLALPRRTAPSRVRIASYPQAQDYFQENVERIADLTAARGVPLLLSTPPSTLRLPGHSQHSSNQTYWLEDDTETQAYRDGLDRRLRLIADSLRTRSAPVAYVPHKFTLDLFLDDCHLKPAGNRAMAEDFVAAARAFITREAPARLPSP